MKKRLSIIIILLLSITVLHAQDTHKPFQLSLFNPVQIVPADYSVHGFRFNLIYGKNLDVKGFDAGLVNVTEGNQTGAQLGAVSITKGEFKGAKIGYVNINNGKVYGYSRGIVNVLMDGGTGWMHGGVNVIEGDIKGLVSGPVNVHHGEGFNGAMIGIVNVGEKTAKDTEGETKQKKGTQIGLVNVANQLKGVQIGLVNINKNARIKFCPFILISKK